MRLVDRVQVRLQLLNRSEPYQFLPNQLRRGIHGSSPRSAGGGAGRSVLAGFVTAGMVDGVSPRRVCTIRAKRSQ